MKQKRGSNSRPAAAEKYLARHAVPEARLAARVPGRFSHAVVVPALAESASLLRGFELALGRASGPVLLLLVVNARDEHSDAIHAANRRLLELPGPDALRLSDFPPAWAWQRDAHTVMLVDRASPGVRLAAREGVGRARRIGCDIGLALWARGQLASSWLHCTDADATLPGGYFAAPERLRASALLYPFVHEASGEREVDRATALHELWLRYYVRGLAWAGSPYAMHTLGSCLCLDTEAYAQVRGFAARQAGEDFHILNKLAKRGPVHCLKSEPVRLRARLSGRAPFGTGASVRRLIQAGASDAALCVYDPRLFVILGEVMLGMRCFARDRERSLALHLERTLSAPWRSLALAELSRLGALGALQDASRRAHSASARLCRFHTWFDALRTLRFLHLLRDAAYPNRPWREAFALAPFLPSELARAGLGQACAALLARELGRAAGVTRLASERTRPPAATLCE